MNFRKYFFIQCIITSSFFPAILISQVIQTGAWASPAEDVGFYISQQSQLDTLRVRITFTSGNCSGSITKYSYGVPIVDRSFSRDLGSVYEGSTGSIAGTFSEDGTSCSGSYSYTTDNCGTVSAMWTATCSNSDTTEADLVLIPDFNFLDALIERGVDTNHDGGISYSEAELISAMDVSYLDISDLTGIEAFINLDSLSCHSNQLSSMDLSGNTELTFLWCSSNLLQELDVSGNPALVVLWCRSNQISTLDVSSNQALEKLSCRSNQLTSLDISGNPALKQLLCRDNQISSLDVSGNPELEVLWCNANPLGSLDVSNNAALYDLWCADNQLTSLDVSKNTSIESLWCEDNQLTSLNISSNTALVDLSCGNNLLTNLDVSNNTSLMYLWFNINNVSSLDISGNSHLVDLWCIGNNLNIIDVSNNPELESFLCSYNQLRDLDVSGNPALKELWCGGNMLSSLNISNNSAIGSMESDYDDLDLSDMPSLYEVCVWTMPFPPPGVKIDTSGSPNVSFTSDCLEGVDDPHLSGFTIYPNPTSFMLNLETEIPGNYLIKISDLSGKLVFGTVMDGNRCQIDLSNYRKGIYLIKVVSNGSAMTNKIIKL